MEKFLLSTTIILIPSALFAVILPATPYTGDMVQNDLGSLQFVSELSSFEGPGADLITMDGMSDIEPIAQNCYTSMHKSPQGECSSEISKNSWAQIVMDVNMMAIECYTSCPENDCHKWFAELKSCIDIRYNGDDHGDWTPVLPAEGGGGNFMLSAPFVFLRRNVILEPFAKEAATRLGPGWIIVKHGGISVKFHKNFF